MIIGICDDEKEIVEILASIIQEILIEKKEEYKIHKFYSGAETVKFAKELDIVFIDINMPGMDGFETGKKIKTINEDCKLVIASSFERYIDAIKLQVFRYIRKNFYKDDVIEVIEAYIKQRIGYEKLEVYSNRILYQIKQCDIEFIEAVRGGSVDIKVGRYYYRKDISLKLLFNELNEKLFFRIHKKYIINFLEVRNYKNDMIILESCELPISIRNRKIFEIKYREFELEYK